MRINLVFNKNIEDYKTSLAFVENLLQKKDVDYKSFDLQNLENAGDIAIVIGGDGTLLNAAKFYSQYKVPVLGLNTGRLGYLSQSEINDFEQVLDAILANKFEKEERLMLQAEDLFALNDFVIKGCNPSRTSKFYLEINDECVCNYVADGLIISTPTGSTAYGLSAGGPILHPTIEALTIVPICPHTLNARPLVVPANEKITIKTGDEKLSLFADGFDSKKCFEKIVIKKAPQKAILAFLRNENFYKVLRNKLHWGICPKP